MSEESLVIPIDVDDKESLTDEQEYFLYRTQFPYSGNYPYEIFDYEYKIDPTTDMQEKISEYQTIYNTEGIQAAIEYLNQEENIPLKQMVFSAADFNKLADGIRAIQKHYHIGISEAMRGLIRYRGGWSEEAEYFKGDLVSYEHGTESIYGYICVDTPNIGIEPPNETHWCKVTIKGDAGLGLSMKYEFNTSSYPYNTNDCVIYNNSIWGCLQDETYCSPDSEENTDGEYWKKIPFFAGDKMPITCNSEDSIKQYIDNMLSERVFPVGSTYSLTQLPEDFDISEQLQNYPNKILGFGEWKLIEERFLVGASGKNNNPIAFGKKQGGSVNSIVVDHIHYPRLNTNKYDPTEQVGDKNTWGFATYTRALDNTNRLVGRRFVTGTKGDDNKSNTTDRYVFAGRYDSKKGKANSGLHWSQRLSSPYVKKSGSTEYNTKANGDGTNANLPPYRAVYIWERIA